MLCSCWFAVNETRGWIRCASDATAAAAMRCSTAAGSFNVHFVQLPYAAYHTQLVNTAPLHGAQQFCGVLPRGSLRCSALSTQVNGST